MNPQQYIEFTIWEKLQCGQKNIMLVATACRNHGDIVVTVLKTMTDGSHSFQNRDWHQSWFIKPRLVPVTFLKTVTALSFGF
jgi:hypothetical protein